VFTQNWSKKYKSFISKNYNRRRSETFRYFLLGGQARKNRKPSRKAFFNELMHKLEHHFGDEFYTF